MNKSYEDLERLISECKLMLNKRDEEIEALKAERDALAAQVRSLQKEKLDLLVYVADSEKWFKKHDPSSYVSPKRDSAQQCLLDIQAEAVIGFIEFNAGRYTNHFDACLSDALKTYLAWARS